MQYEYVSSSLYRSALTGLKIAGLAVGIGAATLLYEGVREQMPVQQVRSTDGWYGSSIDAIATDLNRDRD